MEQHGSSNVQDAAAAPIMLDAVIIGAGFSGLYMLYRLRQLGMKCRLYDSAGGVGGTWYWNRYPGCGSDIESLEYSYSFSEELQQEWQWSRRYASQIELEQYRPSLAVDIDRDGPALRAKSCTVIQCNGPNAGTGGGVKQ